MKRALVTGGTGYLGSRLVRRLRVEDWQVALVVQRGSSLPLPADASISLHDYDGTLASLRAALAESRPHTVIHLATLFLAQHRAEDIEPLIAANITLGTQLLEAMSETGDGRLINIATSWQTMDGSGYRPANLYAATKQAFCDILRYYEDVGLIEAITLHLFDTYGPDDPRGKLVSALCRAQREGASLALSSGEQHLDLLHADDAAAAMLAAATLLESRRRQDAARRDFALRSGRTVSLRELVALVEQAGGKPLDVRWGARPYRPREIMRPASPHPSLPGWLPAISLEAGLRQLIRPTEAE